MNVNILKIIYVLLTQNPKRHNHRHHRNSANSHIHQNHRKSQQKANEIIRSYERPYAQSTQKTDQTKMSLDNLGSVSGQVESNSPEQTYSPHDISPIKQDTGTHMAEKLVESTTGNNAFKFDTITPVKLNGNQDIQINAIALGKSFHLFIVFFSSMFYSAVNNDIKRRQHNMDSSSSDDNGGFVTPPENQIIRKSQVKRATIVGNPMFSNSPDNEIGPGESLGLDDLDMDYEQIMHYFDNLKVKYIKIYYVAQNST